MRGPANITLTVLSRHHRCTITVEDDPLADPAFKCVRVVGDEDSEAARAGVAAVVADIRNLAGPLPLLSGVPVPQEVYDE